MKRRLDLALALVHRPADPVPRRADHRPRHPEPHRALGRGRAARARGWGDRLPDDAVPRGGRRARRPGRDHRPRQASSPRARPTQLRPRSAARRVEAIPPTQGRRSGRGACSSASARVAARRGVAVRLHGGTRSLAEVVRALDAQGLAVWTSAAPADPDDVFLAKTGRSLEGAGTATTTIPPGRARAGAGTGMSATAAALPSPRALPTHRSAPRSPCSRAARSCERSASPRRSSRR